MIKVYHHIYPFQAGEGIADSQKKRLFEKITEEFEYKSNVVKIHQTELWTLKTLQNDCKEMNDDTPILYIHTKGATKTTVERSQWREYMERELIDNYKFHLDILSKGFSSSGVLMGIPYWSSTIYGGNFWWTTAGYIKTLPDNLDWGNWHWDTMEINNGMSFGYIGWAETKFLNKGENFNPYTIPFFKIDGVEQFANLIAEEIEKNKQMDKKALIRGRII